MQKQTKCREATLTLNKRQETLLNFTVLFFMKNSAGFEGFVLTNVHLHCLKCFPLHFFKYFCQSYKMAQNPIIPEKGKSDATHTCTHTCSINMFIRLMELEELNITISYQN